MVWLWLGFYHDALSDDTRFKLLLRYPHECSWEGIDDTELYNQICDEWCEAEGNSKDEWRGSLEIRGNPGILAYRRSSEFFNRLDMDEIQQLADIARNFDTDEFEEINAKDRNALYLYDLYWCMWSEDIIEELEKHVCKDVVGIVVEYFQTNL